MFSSTTRPSTWWNIGEWLTSESQRYTRPGAINASGGVVRRNVQSLEVVEVVLDLRTLGNLEAGTPEQRLDAQPRARERMQAAAPLAAPRQRDVDAATRKFALDRRALELGVPGRQGLLEALLDRVDRLPRLASLGDSEPADALQAQRQLALLAEELHAQFLERGERIARANLRERRGRECVEVGHRCALRRRDCSWPAAR
jgi:hypothetical protein